MSKTHNIAEKLDELLKDDRNFSTRAGLRFMTELVRDAFEYIESEKETRNSVETRLGNVERGLYDFLELRRKEQEKAQDERVRWRWAIITPTIGLLLVEIFRFLVQR